jgi:hypothetical protein
MPTIDRSFLKDLKAMDKRLSAKFNGSHMVITYDRGHGEPVNILRVRGEDGGFRQPDRRDLAIIKGGDLAEGAKMETRLREAAYRSELQRREAKRKAAENIRDMTKDGKRFLSERIGRLTNQGKCNSSVQRITHKPKGKVFAEA